MSARDPLLVEAPAPAVESRLQLPRRSDRTVTPLGVSIAVLLGLGITFRLIHFVATRSLWIDEARVGINIASRSYRELLLPLDYDQTAPPLFLWLTKLATEFFGVNEQALRLLPLVGGIAMVFLAYPFARCLVRPAAAAFVLAGVALSPPLIYYSNEAKPYIVDALGTMGLVWLALDWGKNSGDRRTSLRLLLAGALAVWASTPAPFVLVAIVLAVLLCPAVSLPRRIRFAVPSVVVWLVSFSVAYLAVYRPAAANPYLHEFWAYSFLDPWQPDLSGRAWYAARDLMYGLLQGGSVEPPLGRLESIGVSAATMVFLLLAFGGAYRVQAVGGTWRLATLAAPIAAVVGAALFRLYPISLRLILFAAPLVLILVAAGLDELLGRAGLRRQGLWSGIAALLLAVPLARDLGLASRPGRWGVDHRGAIRDFEQRALDGEPVYVSVGSLPAWIFYTMDWSNPDAALLSWLARLGSYPGAAFENGPPRDTVTSADGNGLTYQWKGRQVVLGLYTGMQVRPGRMLARYRPDPDWGEVEVARMREHANPHIWLILSHLVPVEPGLYRRIYLGGGRLRYRSTDIDVKVAKYWFP